MRAHQIIPLITFFSFLAASCDGHKYKDMDGREVYEKASHLPLKEAYSLYLDSYSNTAPPMLNGAEALRQHGIKGKNYIFYKAKNTFDEKEFQADIAAIAVLNYSLNSQECDILRNHADINKFDFEAGNVVCQ
jgi:hypothetical protein